MICIRIDWLHLSMRRERAELFFSLFEAVGPEIEIKALWFYIYCLLHQDALGTHFFINPTKTL